MWHFWWVFLYFPVKNVVNAQMRYTVTFGLRLINSIIGSANDLSSVFSWHLDPPFSCHHWSKNSMWPNIIQHFRSTNNYEPETIVTLARVSLKVRIKKMRANENNLGLLGNSVWPKSHQGGECRSGLEVEPHLARSTLESSANFRSPSTANGQKFLSFSPDWFTPTEKMRQKVERWKKGTQ